MKEAGLRASCLSFPQARIIVGTKLAFVLSERPLPEGHARPGLQACHPDLEALQGGHYGVGDGLDEVFVVGFR